MSRWIGLDGVEVEVIVLGERPTLRVSQRHGPRRVHIAYCATIRELADHVDLAALVEVFPFAARPAVPGAGAPPAE